MDHWEKVRRMEAHLSSMGLRPGDYAPPTYRLLWRMGIKITPPLFASFWHLASISGFLFTAGWGLLLCMLASRKVPVVPDARLMITGAIAGALVGAVLAWPAHRKIQTLGLPRWSEYRGQ